MESYISPKERNKRDELRHYHDSELSAHPGITATYELIKRSGNEIKINKKGSEKVHRFLRKVPNSEAEQKITNGIPETNQITRITKQDTLS
jgi:hypothetical protein